MKSRKSRVWWMMVAATAVFAVCAWAQTASQPANDASSTDKTAGQNKAKSEKLAGKTGRVSGNDVYVRSGYHENYYPVTKLNRGDEVKMVSEQYGWVEILPPAGTYSVIDKAFVDRTSGNDQAGTLNDSAWVYAGSNLNDRRYAKQVKLEKGTQVQIIGETADGAFCKIQPPSGATLWIKGSFVSRDGQLPEAPQAKSATTKPAIQTVEPGELTLDENPPAIKKSAKSKTEADVAITEPKLETPGTGVIEERVIGEAGELPAMAATKYKMEINAIEAEISAEATKSPEQRNFSGPLAKLQPLASQTDDLIAQEYAKARISQLEKKTEMVGALQELRTLTSQAISSADRMTVERSKITVKPVTPPDQIVVRGEIRVSGLYDGTASRPKRWRIVNPKIDRTIAYIELPPGSPINPTTYYGKYIGIRASETRYMNENNPPLPIYTVLEIVAQDPASVSATDSSFLGTSSAVSIQQPTTVSPTTVTPASRPAASLFDDAPARGATK